MANPYEEGAELNLIRQMQNGIKSIVESVLQGINTLMSKENIEQKTRLSPINVLGAIEAASIIDHQKSVYGDDNYDRVLKFVLDYKTIYAKSEDGQGINDIVKLAHALVLNMKQEEGNTKPDTLQALTGVR